MLSAAAHSGMVPSTRAAEACLCELDGAVYYPVKALSLTNDFSAELRPFLTLLTLTPIAMNYTIESSGDLDNLG